MWGVTMGSIIEIEINRGATPDAYEVQVIQSPAGEASSVIQLASGRLLACRQQLQQVLLASAVSHRGLVSAGERSVRDVGQELFTALFSSPAVSGRFRASCAVAEERGEPLRMVLRVNAPELAALPWEAMYDSETATYVCRREPLVRYVRVASAAAPLQVRLPLRVLALASSPRGLPQLDVEKERHDLTRALSAAVKVGAVDLQWAESATWSELQDLLLSQEWHVVHFIGHGDFDVEHDEGVLALVGADGRVNRVGADRFVDLLREAQPMPRLVVLNSCATATSSAQDLFSGTAAALVRGGVSAVAAMQFEISDAAAIEFCRGFYAAIARGRGVDEAVRSGRVAILGTGGSTLEWITPVLYLRGLDAHLFSVARKSSDQAGTSHPHAVDDTARTAAESKSESRVGNDSDTDLPQVSRTISGPEEPIERDPLERLWHRAKEVAWSSRPFKSDLVHLAAVLPPEERVLGVCRLPFNLTFACSFVVTNRTLYLTCDGNYKQWKSVRENTPERFLVNERVISIPITAVDTCAITDGMFALQVAHEGAITFEMSGSKSYAVLVERFIDAARSGA